MGASWLPARARAVMRSGYCLLLLLVTIDYRFTGCQGQKDVSTPLVQMCKALIWAKGSVALADPSVLGCQSVCELVAAIPGGTPDGCPFPINRIDEALRCVQLSMSRCHPRFIFQSWQDSSSILWTMEEAQQLQTACSKVTATSTGLLHDEICREVCSRMTAATYIPCKSNRSSFDTENVGDRSTRSDLKVVGNAEKTPNGTQHSDGDEGLILITNMANSSRILSDMPKPTWEEIEAVRNAEGLQPNASVPWGHLPLLTTQNMTATATAHVNLLNTRGLDWVRINLCWEMQFIGTTITCTGIQEPGSTQNLFA